MHSADTDQTATPKGAVWSGSALFAQTCLSENLGSLKYYLCQSSSSSVSTVSSSVSRSMPSHILGDNDFNNIVGCIYTIQHSSWIIWAPSSEFVSSSIPSWQILTAHAQPFRGARDLAFCLKVPLDSLLVWASSKVLARLRGCAGSPEPSLLA